MAVGAPGVGGLGKAPAIAAFPIRAHQHFAPFSLYPQEIFPAVRAGRPGLIVMAVGLVAGLHLCYQLRGILPHFLHKVPVLFLALGNGRQLILPLGRKGRRAQLLRGQLHQLYPL